MKLSGVSELQRSLLRWNTLVLMLVLVALISPPETAPPVAMFFSLCVAVAYSLLLMLPLSLLLCTVARWLPRMALVLTPLVMASLFFLLVLDARLYSLYGYHFNGFVWNLIITPGGMESLGSSAESIRDVLALGGLMLLAESVLVWLLWRWNRVRPPRPWARRRMLKVSVAGFLLLLGCQLASAFAQIYAFQPVLGVMRRMPVYIVTTVESFATQVLGIKPVRQAVTVSSSHRLNYPASPLRFRDNPPSPNIVWLVSESLRADMLTAEIMPNVWAFSQRAHRFTNHFSGGNGTRMGMFSMFYGLPGNYWFSFLEHTRAPALMEEIRERQYDLGIYTSNSFVYPEFDRTIFAGVPASQLHTDSEGAYWQADRRNTDRLNQFIAADHQGRPFFAFMFFNSPHARYYFPQESVIRPNYLRNFNYAREDYASLEENIDLIRNRYINAVHHLDQQLGRVVEQLRASDRLQDTIVIITGDHGEEFMEQGRWGHNSELHNGQIHTPLVLWVPGTGAEVRTDPTSHLDLAPTLLPLLGVLNPGTDYSAGLDLFTAHTGRYRLSASWNRLAYIDDHYKVVLPVGVAGLGGTEVTDARDKPLSDANSVIAGLQQNLARVLGDISRFQSR